MKMEAPHFIDMPQGQVRDAAEQRVADGHLRKAIQEVREEYIVTIALLLTDPSRFHGMRKSLEQQEVVGTAKWPKTQTELVVALDDWERLNPRKQQLQRQPQDDSQNDRKNEEQAGGPPKVEGGGDKSEEAGLSFMQPGADDKGIRTNSQGESHCHTCGADDHWKADCPKNKKGTGLQGMQQEASSDSEDSDGGLWVSTGVNFVQRGRGKESASGAKVYLDSCTVRSTIDTELLEGVTDAPHEFSVMCNAGIMRMTKCGKLGDLPAMARENGIANLISIPELEIFFKDHGGELTYSSSGGWTLIMNGETTAVPTEPSGPCKGMPYLFIEDARKIFTVDKDVWSRVNVVSSSEKKLQIQDVKDAYRQLPVSILKKRCDDSSDNSPPDDEMSPKPSAIEIKWQLPKTKGSKKGRIVVSGNSHVQASIRGNMEGLSKRQVIGASDARLKQSCMAATPSEKMRDLVRHNCLNKCSVTLDDLDNANFVFGPKARSNIRGGTTRSKPDKVTVGKVEIPRDFYKLHKFVTLSADVMFCNGLPFMTTVSHNIDFLTAEFLPKRTAEYLSSTLTKVLKLYGKNGFVVRLVHMDNEFACLKDLLPLIEIELTAAGEHVCKIERSHRTIKERARGVLAELLYSYYPTQMIIHLIYHVVLWLNGTNYNLLPNTSAREIVTGMILDIDAHCQQPFGQYCEPHDDQEVTNTMSPRTNPCICLGTTGNRRGTQKVLNLDTNEVVRRRNLKNQSIPVPDSIIRKVNELGIKNKKEKYGRKLEFLDRSKCPYSWTYEDEDEETPLIEFTSHPEMAAEIPGVTWADQMPALTSRGDDSSEDDSSDDESDDDSADGSEEDVFDDTDDALVDFMEQDEETTGVDPVDHAAGVDEETTGVDVEIPGVDAEFPGVDDIPTEVPAPVPTEVPAPVEPTSPVTPRQVHYQSPRMFSQGALNATVASIGPTGVIFNERPRRGTRVRAPPRSYEPTMTGQTYPMAKTQAAAMHFQQAMATAPLVTDDDYVQQLTGTMMMQQHFFQKGLKIFGKKGEAAVEKELTQMHDMQAYTPIDASTLSEAEKKDAINQLMFLTEKRCGKIKARSCADGRKQREYIKKEDASSPTVSLEAMKWGASIFM